MRTIIVDDDPVIGSFLAEKLDGVAYLEPDAILDGHVDMSQVDCVVSDYDFGYRSKWNGAQFLKLVRRDWPNIRCILMSGLDRDVPDGVEFFLKDNLKELIVDVRESHDS